MSLFIANQIVDRPEVDRVDLITPEKNDFRRGFPARGHTDQIEPVIRAGLAVAPFALGYSITEIPVELIREIVDSRIAELAGGAPLQAPIPADVEALVMERLKPILSRLARLEQTSEEPATDTRFDPLAALPAPTAEPDWNLVKRHFRRYGDPSKTAFKYAISIHELKARAKREGWAS